MTLWRPLWTTNLNLIVAKASLCVAHREEPSLPLFSHEGALNFWANIHYCCMYANLFTHIHLIEVAYFSCSSSVVFQSTFNSHLSRFPLIARRYKFLNLKTPFIYSRLSNISNVSLLLSNPGHWSGPILTACDEETHDQMRWKGCREKSPGIKQRLEQRLGRDVCWHHAHRWTPGGRHGYAEWAEAAAHENALAVSLSSSSASLLEIRSRVTNQCKGGSRSPLALLQKLHI